MKQPSNLIKLIALIKTKLSPMYDERCHDKMDVKRAIFLAYSFETLRVFLEKSTRFCRGQINNTDRNVAKN